MLEFEVNIETDVASVRITVELQTLTVAVVVSSLRVDVVCVLHDCPQVTSDDRECQALHVLCLGEKALRECVAQRNLTQLDEACVVCELLSDVVVTDLTVVVLCSNSHLVRLASSLVDTREYISLVRVLLCTAYESVLVETVAVSLVVRTREELSTELVVDEERESEVAILECVALTAGVLVYAAAEANLLAVVLWETVLKEQTTLSVTLVLVADELTVSRAYYVVDTYRAHT